jgi:hypothetical protein
MLLPTRITFGDVKDGPMVLKELPYPMLIGAKVELRATVRRKHGGRTEELRVDGEFRVTNTSLDVRDGITQLVTVEATKVSPTWKAIKNQPSLSRTPRLSPARFPRTTVR